MIVTDNEKRKTNELEEKLKEYRKAVESNGDFLTPKKRDLIIIDVLESTIDMRYIFLDVHKRQQQVNKFIIGAASTIILGGISWFLYNILPELVKHLGTG